MTHLKLFIILSSLFSFNSFAEGNRNFRLEAEKFVNELNTLFKIKGVLKEVKKCGFSTKEPVNNVHSIYFCKKDIEFFEKRLEAEKPLESLLTIISHEYAHFLLDWDISPEANEVLSDFLWDDVAETIYSKIKDDKKIKAQILKAMEASETEISDEEKIKENIVKFLLFGDHVNADALGVKLMLLTGRIPNLATMYLLPYMPNSRRTLPSIIEERTNVLTHSMKDGLLGWSNLVCIGPGRNLSGSNQVLKQYLADNGHNSLLESINQECSLESVSAMFFVLLDRYATQL
jgi:hypothetical protein